MKTVIEKNKGQLFINVKSEDKFRRSDVLQLLSQALATAAAEMVPAELPDGNRKEVIDHAADLMAAAVKNDFVDAASGRTGKTMTFADKEAAFVEQLLHLGDTDHG